jgi:hypothetical protein
MPRNPTEPTVIARDWFWRAAAAPFTQFSTATAGVMLSANGDFKIDGMLSPFPPNPCASPMLLIRNAVNLTWFAVGIFRTDDN